MAPAPVARASAAEHASQPDLTKIQHIVFLVRANRTFDNMFGQFPGAGGATQATMSTGAVVPLGRTPDQTTHDLGHTSESSEIGAMCQIQVVSNPPQPEFAREF